PGSGPARRLGGRRPLVPNLARAGERAAARVGRSSRRGERVSGRPGAVVIGRNEGERLARCLASLAGRVDPLVYVDSGSQDDSVAIARAAGGELVDLEPATPFTAALARNAGFVRLIEMRPGVELVQFLDGDCEVQPGWIEEAHAYLDAHAEAAVVCGRRRRRAPGASR